MESLVSRVFPSLFPSLVPSAFTHRGRGPKPFWSCSPRRIPPRASPHPHPSLALPTSQLFPVAIKLAYSCNYPLAQIMEIYRRYADHLYEKKRAYDESVQQYIHTIGRQGEREERGREPSMTEGLLFVNPVVRG